jgi:glyoxylase-like metal-dependent hydrolase (beta-lactamase superfamily II)
VTSIATDLPGNSQSLDGGAMFGNAPKVVWQKWIPADGQNRIAIVCRTLLLEIDGRRVLLETGIGAFFDPQLKARYGVVEEEHVLLRSLRRHGLGHEDVDVVVLSHLHFDHAGGLLAEYRAGSPPELLFPNARFVTSRAAFERAERPHLRDRASFIGGLPDLLHASGRLVLVDDESEIDLLGPSFSFRQSFGHTPGMLHTLVRGRERSIFFCADLVPGVPWVHLPITMGYDRYPEALIDEKQRWLAEFERDGTWLFFTHDPQVAMARVRRDERGRFVTSESRVGFPEGFDLDAPS